MILWAMRRAVEVLRAAPPDLAYPGESLVVRRFLEAARGEIGHGEEYGNNAGPFVARYKGVVPADPARDLGAWCASFVSWCLEEAVGSDLAAARYLGVPLATWRRKRHGARWLVKAVAKAGQRVQVPREGDLVLQDRGQEGSWQAHVAIVEMATDTHIRRLDGNAGAYPSVVRRHTPERWDKVRRLIMFARLP